MASTPDLFSYAKTTAPIGEHARYPSSPGWKGTDTSRDAAQSMKPKAKVIRQKIYDVIVMSSGLTADEACERAGVDILSGRPRVSELKLQNLIKDTGQRRPLPSGKSGVVWRAA